VTLTTPDSKLRLSLTSGVWTRNCSALECFALKGLGLKSAATRAVFARNPTRKALA